jgi:hypothetical protein
MPNLFSALREAKSDSLAMQLALLGRRRRFRPICGLNAGPFVGDELWEATRHGGGENGAGRNGRNGVREVSNEMAQAFADKEAERRTKGFSKPWASGFEAD